MVKIYTRLLTCGILGIFRYKKSEVSIQFNTKTWVPSNSSQIVFRLHMFTLCDACILLVSVSEQSGDEFEIYFTVFNFKVHYLFWMMIRSDFWEITDLGVLIRLVGGKRPSQGRLEVFMGQGSSAGDWGVVGVEYFDNRAANVVYHMMGYPWWSFLHHV